MQSTPLPNKTISVFKAPTLTYTQRADLCSHPVSKKLFTIMETKQSNVAVAADVRTKQELLDLVDAVGPHICMLKTHIDIIDDFDWSLIEQLKTKAAQYNFVICEDRKFADIGSTMLAQCTGGLYRITEWADIIIAHAIAGPGIMQAVRATNTNCALLLLAQLSCKDNLITQAYTQQVCQWAKEYDDMVIGIIGQDAQLNAAHLIKATPGVNLNQSGDQLGQQYNNPAYALGELMSDIIIVGRGIYKAANQQEAAQAYQHAAWTAYQKRLA